MSVVAARPLGSREPPERVLVPMPVFRYGLLRATCPSGASLRMRIVARGGGSGASEGTPKDAAAGGGGAADEAIEREGREVQGYLLFEFDAVRPHVRYDGYILADGRAIPVFGDAELYRLALDDASYRVLAQPTRLQIEATRRRG